MAVETTTVIGGADQKEDFAERPDGPLPFDWLLTQFCFNRSEILLNAR